MTSSTSSHIRKYILSRPPGAVFTARDCMNYGNSSAVYKGLWREVNDGYIVRVAWGVFFKPDPARPGHLPQLSEIVRAKARAFGRDTISHECQLLDELTAVPIPGAQRVSAGDLDDHCCHGSFLELPPVNQEDRSATNESEANSTADGNEKNDERICEQDCVSGELLSITLDECPHSVSANIKCDLADMHEQASMPIEESTDENTNVAKLDGCSPGSVSASKEVSFGSSPPSSELSAEGSATLLNICRDSAEAPKVWLDNGTQTIDVETKGSIAPPAISNNARTPTVVQLNRRILKDAIYDTNGNTSSFNTIYGRVYLHHVSARKMQLGDSDAGKVLRALWCVGAADIADTHIFRGMNSLGRKEKGELRARLWLTPNWLKDRFDIWKYVEPAA